VERLTIKNAKHDDLPHLGFLVNIAHTQAESVNTRGRATREIRSAIPNDTINGNGNGRYYGSHIAVDGANANANEPYSRQHKRNNWITGTGRHFGKWKGNII
jgi:hypothetical protein